MHDQIHKFIEILSVYLQKNNNKVLIFALYLQFIVLLLPYTTLIYKKLARCVKRKSKTTYLKVQMFFK